MSSSNIDDEIIDQDDVNIGKFFKIKTKIDIQKSNVFVDEAIQLIDFTNNSFKLNPKALDIIKAVEEEIIVVAVVGKARTGKSYLMNLLLDNVGKGKGKGVKYILKNKKFQVDSKIASCTQGIWLWGNYKKSIGSKNTKILFIGTIMG